MPIEDNGDIVRAVGFVAIYGAYLENRIAELIEMVSDKIDLRRNIHLLSANDQSKHLMLALKKSYSNVLPYSGQLEDSERVLNVLSGIPAHLKDRNEVIHSILISKSGAIKRKNRRNRTQTIVESQEIIEVANNLYELQTLVSGLKFPVRRLISALIK